MLFGMYAPLSGYNVPGITAVREHLYQLDSNQKWVWPPVNGPIPVRWPNTLPGITGFYTIYPHPDNLLAGKLDTRLRGFISSAPAQGGVLTAYAEADADSGNGGQFATAGLTKDKLHRVHQHLQGLCKGTRVKYGAVFCGTGADAVSFAVPGLDFYALDWYDSWQPRLIAQLDTWRRNIGQLQRSPVLAIAETNSNIPARRPYWFSAVYGWLAGYGHENGGRALGFWTYFHPGGKLSGSWLPGDVATIAALTSIAKDATG